MKKFTKGQMTFMSNKLVRELKNLPIEEDMLTAIQWRLNGLLPHEISKKRSLVMFIKNAFYNETLEDISKEFQMEQKQIKNIIECEQFDMECKQKIVQKYKKYKSSQKFFEKLKEKY